MLLKGNCIELLAKLPDNSIDCVVTDPPYELGFMGKSWDNSGIAYNVELWGECLRVLKPGGHLLAFGGSRTYHRLASAVEDSGFEVRDQIMWLYGSGFPKSLNLSKAIDKAAGAERQDRTVEMAGPSGLQENPTLHVTNAGTPATPEAKQWEGWGTALKPAHEPICVARKPLIGTVANNVLTYGTGALNIDGSRVEHSGDGVWGLTQNKDIGFGGGIAGNGYQTQKHPLGRWPANVIHDGSDEVLAGFPTTTTWKAKNPKVYDTDSIFGAGGINFGEADSGSAARFFYCAKASKSERNAGLDIEQFPLKNYTEANKMGGAADTILTGSGNPRDSRKQNFHPTVKPLALMRYLVKLVTPPGGTVLDPFLGSGTTACAAILEGFEWLGCEMTEDYWPIIEARVLWAEEQRGKQQEAMF